MDISFVRNTEKEMKQGNKDSGVYESSLYTGQNEEPSAQLFIQPG